MTEGSITTALGAVHRFEYQGAVIRDRGEMLCLTDMWRAAGADPAKQPAKWRELPSAQEFAAHVASVILRKSEDEAFRVVRGGREPATWAHWQIGLAYAKYLSPPFHAWCNTVVRERMEGRQAPRPVTVGEIDAQVRQVLGGIVRGVVARAFEERLEPVEQAVLTLHEQIKALNGDPAVKATVEYRPAIEVLKEMEVPPRGRRRLSQRCSTRLRRFCLERHRGDWMRISRETGRFLFHVDAIAGWLDAEGRALILDHKAKVEGQGIIVFPKRRRNGSGHEEAH